MGNLANSADPDEMQHIAAFHLGLQCLLRLKQPSGTEKYNLETSTCDLFKYKMGNPILNILICIGEILQNIKGLMGKLLILA